MTTGGQESSVPDSTTSPRQTATIIEEHFGRKALYVNFRPEQAIVKRPEYAPKTKPSFRFFLHFLLSQRQWITVSDADQKLLSGFFDCQIKLSLETKISKPSRRDSCESEWSPSSTKNDARRIPGAPVSAPVHQPLTCSYFSRCFAFHVFYTFFIHFLFGAFEFIQFFV